jgi:hypothetical protein
VTVDGQRIGVGGHRTRPATEFGPDRSWVSVRKMGSKFGVMTSTLPPPSPRGSSSAQIRIGLVELGRQANCQLVRPATRGAAARQKTITMARYARGSIDGNGVMETPIHSPPVCGVADLGGWSHATRRHWSVARSALPLAPSSCPRRDLSNGIRHAYVASQ